MAQAAPLVDHIPFRLELWLGFFALVATLLFLDLFFHRRARVIRAREACLWTTFWIGLALGFNVWIYFHFGEQMGREFGKVKALEFLTGYLIEEALSVDNLFVFVVIFRHFGVKPEYQHRILFWGILGAIVMRLLFVLAGTQLIGRFHFVIYILGAFLLVTGIKLLFHDASEADPSRSWVLRLFKRWFPVTTEFEGPKFLVRRGDKLFATPLLLVLVVVESTDVVFAVDSVPAVIGITTDPFIVFTSNIFAILGLRSIYFLLAGMMDAFRFLKVGLSLVLIFVGLKMVISERVLNLFGLDKLSPQISLAVIVSILFTAVTASLVIPRHRPHSTVPPEEQAPSEPPEEG